jgi:hypothetical protein
LVKWAIDGAESDQHRLPCQDAQKDPEKKWHTIDIKEFGIKPIKVSSGAKIDCMVKVESDS